MGTEIRYRICGERQLSAGSKPFGLLCQHYIRSEGFLGAHTHALVLDQAHGWYATIRGERCYLGPNKAAAQAKFCEFMARPRHRRCLRWCEEQGLIARSPIAHFKKPRAGIREVVISPVKYQAMLAAIQQRSFRDLRIFAWELPRIDRSKLLPSDV